MILVIAQYDNYLSEPERFLRAKSGWRGEEKGEVCTRKMKYEHE
jgi:hypothetical protein